MEKGRHQQLGAGPGAQVQPRGADASATKALAPILWPGPRHPFKELPVRKHLAVHPIN